MNTQGHFELNEAIDKFRDACRYCESGLGLRTDRRVALAIMAWGPVVH